MQSIVLPRSARRPVRTSVLLLCALGASSLTVAQAASGHAASSICSKVSAASVSALVGYTVPAATSSVRNLPATSKDGGISAVVTTCTFGPQASLAELLKDVTLTLEVTSKPLTITEIQKDLASSGNANLKITVKPYSGLGVPALYFSETGAGITGQGISGLSGTRIFGASVEKALPMAKLAGLAKLAGKL